MKYSSLLLCLLMSQGLATSALAGPGHDHGEKPQAQQAADHDHGDAEHSHGEDDHSHDKPAATRSGGHSHGEAGHGDDHDDDHDEAATISATMAKQVGIEVATAAAGSIERHLQVYGELVIPPTQQAQVRARFPGVVTRINATIGDHVKKGDVLASIESNDSLRSYNLTAPISGVVLQQQVSLGEMAVDLPVMTLLDPSQLWAELKVFPAQLGDVKVGQPVHILAQSGRYDSRITHILPSAANQPYVYVRVALDNSDGRYLAGERVSALIDVEILTADLVVDNLALQDYENKPVVFVREGDRYEPRPLKLGRSDGRFSEVLDGLHAGEEYVVANSYLIKAEIEKSSAAHEH